MIVITIPVPQPGKYLLKLHFAELSLKAQPGSRTFDIAVNGQSIATEYDVFVEAGSNTLKGVILNTEIVVTDTDKSEVIIKLTYVYQI